MRVFNTRLFYLLTLTGGLIWIVCGVLVILQATGDSKISFIQPMELTIYYAIGLLFIGISLGVIMLCNRNSRGLLQFAAMTTIMGSVAHALGHAIHIIFHNSFRWEPLVLIGFLAVSAGLFLLGLSLYIDKRVSRLTSLCFIVTAICLFLFKVQFYPFMAIQFGLGIIIASSLLVNHEDYYSEVPTDQRKK